MSFSNGSTFPRNTGQVWLPVIITVGLFDHSVDARIDFPSGVLSSKSGAAVPGLGPLSKRTGRPLSGGLSLTSAFCAVEVRAKRRPSNKTAAGEICATILNTYLAAVFPIRQHSRWLIDFVALRLMIDSSAGQNNNKIAPSKGIRLCCRSGLRHGKK